MTFLLTSLGAAIFALVVVGGLLLLGALLGERLRILRQDRSGYQRWVESGAPMAFPEILAAFRDDVVVDCGKLQVRSGEVIACDPAFLDCSEPFDEPIPIGEWTVHAVIMADKGPIAALRLVWEDAEITYFTPAWTASDRKEAVATALAHVSCRFGHGLPGDDETREVYIPRKEEEFWDYAVRTDLPVAELRYPEGANLFTCQAGYGDGSYPCYFGRNAEGRAVALFVDFLIGEPRRLPAPVRPEPASNG